MHVFVTTNEHSSFDKGEISVKIFSFTCNNTEKVTP